MRRFIFQLTKYALVIFVISNLIAFGAQLSLQHSSMYKASFLVNNFQPEKQFDYFITGSSRGLTSIGSQEIDENLGTYGINLSQDDTGLPSHILMAEHFFESGYKSKYCVLAIDEAHFNSSILELNDNDYRMAPFINRTYIYDYFKEMEHGFIRPLTLSRYFPVFAYGYYNTELFFPSLLSLVKPSYRHRFDEKGDYTYPETNILTKQSEYDGNKEVEEVRITNSLISDFREYLKKQDCELILYIAPYSDLEITVLNSVEMDLINHSSLLSDPSLFFDPIHVNSKGKKVASEKFAEEFGRIIKEHQPK